MQINRYKRQKQKKIVGGHKMKHDEFIPGKYYKIDRKILHFIRQEPFKNDEGKTYYRLFFINKYEKNKFVDIKEKYKVTATEVVNPFAYDEEDVSNADDDIYLTASDRSNKSMSPDIFYSDEGSLEKIVKPPLLKLYKPSKIPVRTKKVKLVPQLKKSKIPVRTQKKKIRDGTVANLRDNSSSINMMNNNFNLNKKPHDFRNLNSSNSSPLLPFRQKIPLTQQLKIKKSSPEVRHTRSSMLRLNKLKLNTTRKLPKI
jgi:hypothetical protein